MGIIKRRFNPEEIAKQYDKFIPNVDVGNVCFKKEQKVEGISVQRQWEMLARMDYSFYLSYVHNGLYKHSKHTEYICKIMQDIEAGKEDRVIFCLPPRHSKSMTISETFPSYFIGRNNQRRVIEVSYGDRLAKRFGRLNKAKIREFGARLFNLSLPEWGVGVASSTDWGVMNATTKESYRGGMLSTGIGGSITGEGADLLLIDDPIKNREEAYSQVYRDKIWEEWKNTLRTRLQPNGAVVIILTRWHEDDLVGRLLNPKYSADSLDKGKKWKIVSLPVICDSEDDLLGRKIGQCLWPEFGFDEEWAKFTMIDVGSRVWASLYQQKPSAAEGQVVKRGWWKEYNSKAIPEMIEIIQSWDCAYEEKDNLKGSYSVCTTWGRGYLGYYLLDVYRKQIEYPELIKQMKALHSKWNPSAVIIEYKASGKSAYQALKVQTAIPLLKVIPHKSKLVRMEIVNPMIESGRTFLPDTAPWLYDYLEEMSLFNNGEYDDQVDSTSQALSYFQQRAGRFIVTSDEYEEKEEEKKIISIEGMVISEEFLPESIVVMTEEEKLLLTEEDIRKAVMIERYGEIGD